jgi:prephenate dehydrogenase
LGRVAILGVGLIGGSLGQDLCAIGASECVTGWDADPATLEAAIQVGAIQRTASALEEAVGSAELVVIATPLGAVLPTLRSIAPHLSATAFVTDVGSAKARIVAEAEEIIGGRFIGGHPMAGSEESGVLASSVDLFDAAAWIITPTPRTDPAGVEVVKKMAELAGARPRICDPETHDRLVASLSHLPHVLAYGLAETVGERIPNEWVDLVAGSFRDGSRVAASNPEGWTEILLDNKSAVAEALDGFSGWLAEVRSAIDTGDHSALGILLGEAHRSRKRFPR